MKNYKVTITFENSNREPVSFNVSALSREGAAMTASKLAGMVTEGITLYTSETEIPESKEVIARYEVIQVPAFYIHYRERE